MKSTTLIPSICLALSTACVTPAEPPAPTNQDTDFLRGCWIERNGANGRHIRFIPDRDNPAIYKTYIPGFADYPTPPNTTVMLELAINGASLTRTILDKDQAPIETATLKPAPLPLEIQQPDQAAAWRFGHEQRWYIAHATDERTLRLFILDGASRQPTETEDFSGPRDGCD